MADSVSRRSSIDAAGSTSPLSGTTAPLVRADTEDLPIAGGDLTTSHDSHIGESPSSRARQAVVIDEQKTVISKKPPLSDPLPLPRVTTPAEMGRILVGERLSHFELEEFVGGGGMGAVFRATDTMLNRTVAVKVLSRDQTDEETLKRFKNEAQNAARLDHERIARVYYVGEDKGWHYIVFEYIDGVNVRDLVDEKGPLSLDEAVLYTLQVTEALRHAYRRDVVHRDIKPSNILVTPDGRAKLVDMGLARLHQVESPQNDLTASGVTLGTFDYISPEQARDPRNADVRSDIYSLGCTLYYMLTGRPPFPDGTVLQKLLSHSTDPPPDPRLYRPDIPEDICRVLTKTLAKNPLQRFQSPDDLIAELLAVADRLGLENTSRSGAGYIARPVTKAAWYEQHLPWAAPAITLVVVILALDWFGSATTTLPGRPKPTLLPAAASEAPPQPVATPAESPASPPMAPVVNTTPAVTPAETAANTKKKTEAAPPAPTTIETVPPSNNVSAATPMPPITPAGSGEVAGSATEPASAGGVGETPLGAGIDAASTTTTTSPAPTATVTHRVLAVGPSNTPVPAGVKIYNTLAAATAAAANLPDIDTIELHYDGERVEPAFELSSPTLTIRPAPGRSPAIVFRPAIDTLAAEQQMIRITQGHVSFQGLQLRLELPAQHAGEGWSLFSLQDIRSLALERCALTIRNATATGVSLQSNVAFLALHPGNTETSGDPTSDLFVPPLIQLTKTVARGEATLVRADTGTPFALRWNQGLLSTTQRLADIGGAADTQLWDSWVRLDLSHVTAATREGLCIMRSSPTASRHLALQIDATNCIVLTESSVPLIEHQTYDTIEKLKTKHPEFTGDGNIFSGPREFWRIVSLRTSDPPEPTFTTAFAGDATQFGFSEDELLAAVMWKSLPLPGSMPHSHLKADFLLSDDPRNPALRRSGANPGFDPAVVPEFQTEARSPSPLAPPQIDPLGVAPSPAPATKPMPTPLPPSPSAGASRSSDMQTPDMKPADTRMPMMRDPNMSTPTITPR